MSKKFKNFWFNIAINLVCGITASVSVAILTFYYLKENVSSMVSKSVGLLDTGNTIDALKMIESQCSSLLQSTTSRPVSAIDCQEIVKEVEAIEIKLKSVKQTEYYSLSEIQDMADKQATINEQKIQIVNQYQGKPKFATEGIPELQNELSNLKKLTLKFESCQQNNTARLEAKIRESIANIISLIKETRAKIESRKKAVIDTVHEFGRQ